MSSNDHHTIDIENDDLGACADFVIDIKEATDDARMHIVGPPVHIDTVVSDGLKASDDEARQRWLDGLSLMRPCDQGSVVRELQHSAEALGHLGCAVGVVFQDVQLHWPVDVADWPLPNKAKSELWLTVYNILDEHLKQWALTWESS